MARENGKMITLDDANYMVLNEGFIKNENIPSGKSCLTKAEIIRYLNADTSLFSTYTDKQLVPYDRLIPLAVDCNTNYEGTVGNFSYSMNFGSATGVAGIRCDPGRIPDKFTIIWDGNVYTTGWIGSTDFDQDLINAGIDPSEINTTAPNAENFHEQVLTFNKNKVNPTTATIIVNGVLENTFWNIYGKCPGTV